jgi:hypothetical protein
LNIIKVIIGIFLIYVPIIATMFFSYWIIFIYFITLVILR